MDTQVRVFLQNDIPMYLGILRNKVGAVWNDSALYVHLNVYIYMYTRMYRLLCKGSTGLQDV